MVLRAIALSMALLIGVGTLVPLATEYAEAGSRKTRKYKKKKRQWRGVKPYSKRWWQLYRAQERRKRALAKRRRALRLRQIRLARARRAAKARRAVAARSRPVVRTRRSVAALPTGDPAPKGWVQDSASNSEVQFRVANTSGSELGTAAITVVGPATGETSSTGRMRTVGGVPTTALRRDVINRMIRENGWVVNDYQKEVGGKTVYVVVAQSQAKSGRVHSRLFYFTEAEGRIYSVATNSATDSAEQLAEESEKVVQSLHSRPRPIQQAAIRD